MLHVRHVQVVTKAMAGEVQEHKQQDQDEADDSKHLHPAWYGAVPSARFPHQFGTVGDVRVMLAAENLRWLNWTRRTITDMMSGILQQTKCPECPVLNNLLDLSGNTDEAGESLNRPPHSPHQGDAAARPEFIDPEEGL
jgi:hypothetical protein